MLFRDIIELVNVTTTTKNDIGDPVVAKTYTSVFADKLAINQSEFYQSNNQGLRLDLKFKCRYTDYNNQTQIRYPKTTGKTYDIIRTYNKNDEFIELTCQGVISDGNA